jgi:hypothetical protein
MVKKWGNKGRTTKQTQTGGGKGREKKRKKERYQTGHCLSLGANSRGMRNEI